MRVIGVGVKNVLGLMFRVFVSVVMLLVGINVGCISVDMVGVLSVCWVFCFFVCCIRVLKLVVFCYLVMVVCCLGLLRL